MISRLVFASLTALFAFRREDSDVGLTFRSFTQARSTQTQSGRVILGY